MYSPDIRAENVDGLEDSEEDRSLELGLSWQANAHLIPSWPKVIDGLAVALALRSYHKGVRRQQIDIG